MTSNLDWFIINPCKSLHGCAQSLRAKIRKGLSVLAVCYCGLRKQSARGKYALTGSTVESNLSHIFSEPSKHEKLVVYVNYSIA